MGKLIYSMITSLDGYVSDADGNFDWAMPDDELHEFVNQQSRSIGTYLCGRRMYETMVFWETADAQPDLPAVYLEYATIWQTADKVVYSTTLDQVASERTRIERTFDPDAVRRLKAESDLDLSVDGPDLAAQALHAGLVDECRLYVVPVIVGGGHRFFPEGVRADLDLLDQRRFADGTLYLRYAVRATP